MACKINIISHGFYWELGDSSYVPVERTTRALKEVFQYDLQGNFVTSYESASHAAKELGVTSNGIQCATTGKSKIAFGFIWLYEYKGPKIEPYQRTDHPTSKSVDCFDLDKNYIATYKSAREAKRILNLSPSADVGVSCRVPFGKRIVKGFYWRFSDPPEIP